MAPSPSSKYTANAFTSSIAVVIVATLAVAQPLVDSFSFSRFDFEGLQHANGPVIALVVSQSDAAPSTSLHGFASTLELVTTTRSEPSVYTIGYLGDDVTNHSTLHDAAFIGAEARQQFDLLIVADPAKATLTTTSSKLAVQLSQQTEVSETPHVNTTRWLYTAPVADAIQATTNQATLARIEGTFSISIWQWNITTTSKDGERTIPTGGYREVQQADPVTGAPILSTAHTQVLQANFTNGWLELASLNTVEITYFAQKLALESQGNAVALHSSGALAGQTIEGTLEFLGPVNLNVASKGRSATASVTASSAKVLIDGTSITSALGELEPVPGTVIGDPVPKNSHPRTWLVAGGIGALTLLALASYAPVQGARFAAIERRFEHRDYLRVLESINPFTRRRRFTRRATLLRIVSLLSLKQFKEAALYLASLEPWRSPDPATRAFLQACAAAGLDQNGEAVHYLQECLKHDPAYVSEARNIPLLSVALTYIQLDEGDVNAGR